MTLNVEVHIRVARCGDKPVKTTKWIDAHVAAANRIFNRHGIELDVKTTVFDPPKCVLLTRRDRNSLGKLVHSTTAKTKKIVMVLVMQRIRDLDVPSYNLMGVHWRYRGSSSKRWIYLTARARPPVLAHELAHFFGLRHDRKGGNLMTPGPSDPIYRKKGAKRPKPFAPRFSKRQARRLRANIKRFLAAPRPRPKQPSLRLP